MSCTVDFPNKAPSIFSFRTWRHPSLSCHFIILRNKLEISQIGSSCKWERTWHMDERNVYSGRKARSIFALNNAWWVTPVDVHLLYGPMWTASNAARHRLSSTERQSGYTHVYVVSSPSLKCCVSYIVRHYEAAQSLAPSCPRAPPLVSQISARHKVCALRMIQHRETPAAFMRKGTNIYVTHEACSLQNLTSSVGTVCRQLKCRFGLKHVVVLYLYLKR